LSALRAVQPSAASLAAEIDTAEYARLLGLPRGRPLSGDLAERARAARAWYAERGEPWVAARRTGIARLDRDEVALDNGHVFASRTLADRLREGAAHGLVALAVTAGGRVDEESRRLWEQERPDEAYFLDRFGACVAERLVSWAAVWICRDAESRSETVLAHLSPGCADWSLTQQEALMSVVSDGTEGVVGPLRMLSSGMLTPKNSLLAVRGLTPHAVAPSPADACRSCDLTPCGFRRAPHRGAA
jgi:hypothetical protein